MISMHLSRLARCTLVAAAVLSLGSPSTGLAQDADVKAAVDANHAAIQSRNIGNLAAVWSHDADVTLVNPRDTTVAVGWDAVKGRWEQIFSTFTGFEISQTDGPHIVTTGDVARSVGIVHVVVQLKSERKEFNYVETDVFQKQGGHWLIVLHTARPI